MSISRVWIEEGCIICACAETCCPEVFKVDLELNTVVVVDGVDFSKYEQGIIDAAYSCPVEVIKYE
jgi:ferredoxin